MGQGTINGQQHAFLMTPGVPEQARTLAVWAMVGAGGFSWRGDVGYKPEGSEGAFPRLRRGLRFSFRLVRVACGRVDHARLGSRQSALRDLRTDPAFLAFPVATVRQPVVQTGAAPSLGRQSDPQHFFAPAQAWPRKPRPPAIGTTGRTAWGAPPSLNFVISGQMS